MDPILQQEAQEIVDKHFNEFAIYAQAPKALLESLILGVMKDTVAWTMRSFHRTEESNPLKKGGE